MPTRTHSAPDITDAPLKRRALILRAAACLLALSAGCWGKDEEPKPAPRAEQPKTAPALPAPAPQPQPPSTHAALQHMPESATAVVAFPTLDRFFGEWLTLVKRFAPDPTILDQWVNEVVEEGARQFDEPQAASFADLLRAKGIDPDAPVAIYADAEPLARAYDESLKLRHAQEESPATAESSEVPMGIEVDATPNLAVAVRYTDPVVAEQTARDLIASWTGPQPQPPANGHMVIHVLSPHGKAYFLRDGWIVVSNSEEFLRQIGERFDAPAPVRYGTSEVPASAPDEAVALVRPDRLVALMRGLLPILTLERTGLSPWYELSYPLLDEAAEAYSDDPLIVTLNYDRQRLDLVARLDYARHPKVQKLFGEPAALRLAALLPPDSVGFLSMRITDENKQTLEKAWFEGRRFADPQVRRSMEILRLLLQITGNHLSIGVAGITQGWPKGIVLVELGDVDTTRALLTTLGAPLEPLEVHSGIEIMQIPLPLPQHLYYALTGDILFLADDLQQLRNSVDLFQKQQLSPFFERLQPPFDPNEPRYNALVLTDAFFGSVLRPLVRPAGTEDPITAIVTNAANVVQQVQASRTVRNGWREGRVTVYLRNAAS